MEYCHTSREVRPDTTNKEKHLLARAFVSGITSDPEKLEIEVGLTAPLFPSTCGGGGRN